MELVQSSCEVLKQLESLIIQLKKEEYSAPMKILSENSIGKHIRHILEMFQQMIRSQEIGYIDYDERPHNELLEIHPDLAIQTINKLQKDIQQIRSDMLLTMNSCYAASLKKSTPIQTSLTRELLYTIEHAVHHMAIIKISVQQIKRTILLPENFGVAQSTINYRKNYHCK